jgi:hypothetical protein
VTPPDIERGEEPVTDTTSKNERAGKLFGMRPSGIPIDCPCELGYQCPKCRIVWDETLEWSEYNSFLWCPRCDFDYPSALCVPLDAEPDPARPYVNAGRDAAVRVLLDSVEGAFARLTAPDEGKEPTAAQRCGEAQAAMDQFAEPWEEKT